MKTTIAIIKGIAIAAIVIVLTNCAGLSISASTPYGDVSTDAKGNIVVAPKPIIIPQK